MEDETQSEPLRYIRSRIGNACDGCKARKVKCDGKLPCGYCAGRQRGHTCHYSPQKRRKTPRKGIREETKSHPRNETPIRSPVRRRDVGRRDADREKTPRRTSEAAEDTEVQRDARLLQDAQGKLIFIGDCAPLSFFQSVRQVVTSRVSANAFAPESSRYSVLENVPTGGGQDRRGTSTIHVGPQVVGEAVSGYLDATAGLVDLFDDEMLLDDMVLWANVSQKPRDISSTINYLILAIGVLVKDESLAQEYFEHARNQAYEDLNANLSVGTVQAFVLITVYMLCACQINSAFLFFGISVRAAYSIGVHRTEVNGRFGPSVRRQRDRLWKSLRVVDLFLSISMGRPPATSDVDCTVAYEEKGGEGKERFDLLNASVQILLITEQVVVEVYSRKKISLQLTEGISMKLRKWSEEWMHQLKEAILGYEQSEIGGACQVLCSYYYSVMLVSRPFLMYELYRRLSQAEDAGKKPSGKTKLADACIDAASLMVDEVLGLMERGALNHRAPMIVSWMFSASLVLGVGLMGSFGRILEKYMRMSIQILDHFAKSDSHARQYSLIAQSLLSTALEFLEKKELEERQRRTENSSQLFGLMTDSPSSSPRPREYMVGRTTAGTTPTAITSSGMNIAGVNGASEEMDSAFLGLSDMLTTPGDGYWNSFDDAGGSANLFPLLESGGGIDLAHYF